ncbi:hypothetical protein QFC22_000572 [Naganishia vaughanmartiniae]|uniref:Uncharacterized protein n=1 Tax=Naganishia vaughanmartiniae TaxID=1424756 RepID=A0ACC2XQF9_9TREE|nr:hypothetical protein QFC22_000572 [Naganishia vaughanmartiniae]
MPSTTPPKTRSSYLRLLAGVQNTSALAFSTFLAVHLASPVFATFGGGEVANQVMLLGRAYYHPLEPVLIYGSVSAHLAASLLRRLHMLKTTQFHRPALTLHHMTGYLLIPFLTLHVLTHRLIPSSSAQPINGLSPAELDYSFVSYGLRMWPVVSWTTYALLIVTGVSHGMSGLPKVFRWFTTRSKAELETARTTSTKDTVRTPARRALSGKWANGASIGLISLLGVALFRLHAEDPLYGSFMRKRVDAVYRSIPWLYRS